MYENRSILIEFKRKISKKYILWLEKNYNLSICDLNINEKFVTATINCLDETEYISTMNRISKIDSVVAVSESQRLYPCVDSV